LDTSSIERREPASRETEANPRGFHGNRGKRPGDLPLVAIVGRPNVGKSTLFNRLLGSRKAIVQDTPGVTRDTIVGRVEWGSAHFLLMDTGGLETTAPSKALSEKVRLQIARAVGEADLLLLVVDGRVGVHPQDLEAVRVLRKSEKPMLCAVNKMDTMGQSQDLYAHYRLGVEPLLPVSAEHGIGLGELLDAVVEALPEREQGLADEEEARPIGVAVVGRPNVGKSTLVNALLGEERQLVDERPGTTRDAVDTPFTWDGKRFLLIDTAGIRRRARVRAAVEKFSVIKALQSLDRCDVGLLMTDATEGITDQDARIGNYILEKGRGVVILVNKWDLLGLGGREAARKLQGMRDKLPHLGFAPVVPVSALTGYNVSKVLGWVHRVERASRLHVPTGPLNRLLGEAVKAHAPPSHGTRIRRLQYITQIKERPPTFLVFSNISGEVPMSYQRFLIHRIRGRFGFKGVPIRLVFRRKR
jgi:GTP-binding protein